MRRGLLLGDPMPVDLVGRANILPPATARLRPEADLRPEPLGEELDIPNGFEMQESRLN